MSRSASVDAKVDVAVMLFDRIALERLSYFLSGHLFRLLINVFLVLLMIYLLLLVYGVLINWYSLSTLL